jgi:hypothetical protein
LALVPLPPTTSPQNDDRRFCFQPEQETTQILEPTGGTRGASNGCIPPTLACTRIIPPSTVAIDSESTQEVTSGQSTISCATDSDMAHTILVANGIDQSSEITNYLTRFPPVVFDRMALIASIHCFQGIGSIEIQYFTKALHKRTHTMYNTHWRNWAEWCLKKSPPVNPLAHNPHRYSNTGIIEVKIFRSSKRSAMWGYFSVGSSLSGPTITIETYFDQTILQVSTTCQTCDPKHNAGSL